jgi:hypothetical protein
MSIPYFFFGEAEAFGDAAGEEEAPAAGDAAGDEVTVVAGEA